ncbi:MAG: thiolase family protein [Candidatus Obscuribacterales bacterium]|nr:thiolase family protein [Candidatus Obscuribacterales bacterium]
MTSNKALLIGGLRTPIASYGRSLADVTVDKLAEHTLLQLFNRSNLDPSAVDGFVLGHAFQSGLTPNTARFTWLNAGLPASTYGYTIQIQCGSGMKAVNNVMDSIALGHGSLYIAGGAESMSTIPYIAPASLRSKSRLNKMLSRWLPKIGPRLQVGIVDDGLAPLALIKDTRTVAMAHTAQRLADQYGVSRAEMDAFSLLSQERAAAAIKSGRFEREITPVLTKKGIFAQDEHPRQTSAEALAKLKPSLGTRDITPGNASGINDAACLLAVASEAKVAELGVQPLAVLADHVTVALDPEQMGLGPVYAIRKLLERNGLSLADIDLFELNEAFAAQYLACEKLLGLDRAKVNVNGGAVALGHPIAMSGARVILTLAHELKVRGLKRGIATLCVGGGMGVATLVESL